MSLGADSTNSFASFSPKPVAVLTSLITLIFLSPTSERTIVNESFSSADSPPASPPGATAATATGAAAETPHFSSRIFDNSDASRTVKFDYSSAIFSKSAIFFLLIN